MASWKTTMRSMLDREAMLRLYSTTALLHDFDYEQHPDEHPLWGMNLLELRAVDPVIIRAIASHYAAKTGVSPESALERHLYACDELTGFIAAVAGANVHSPHFSLSAHSGRFGNWISQKSWIG